MWPLVVALLGSLRSALRTRADLALENIALRQQLALLAQRSKRPQFGAFDKFLCPPLSALATVARRLVPHPSTNRHPLAWSGIPGILDLEIAAPWF